ncbi:class I SAM-dependent methyltransferase [Nonomuraea sp. NPDC026600]|uniref:class I SAM-dependent methyltransferase n=1 Tax=Nonomuraea sp. NPDC026600 TaxID=3155363 RepID=UPI0033DDBDD9
MAASAHRFERWAATYDKSLIAALADPVHTAVLTAHHHLPHPRHLLDLGCGTGRLLRRAADRFPTTHLIGLDAAHAMLTVAYRTTQLQGSPALGRARAEQLPFPGASLDIITATLTCRHWHDVRTGLEEIARVLATGGVFVYADIHPPAPRRRWWRRCETSGWHLLDQTTGMHVIEDRPVPGCGTLLPCRLLVAGRS